jgi:hypothetical protein
MSASCTHIEAYKYTRNFTYLHSLVESEALVRAFSPGSTLEPELKAFYRRGPKWLL